VQILIFNYNINIYIWTNQTIRNFTLLAFIIEEHIANVTLRTNSWRRTFNAVFKYNKIIITGQTVGTCIIIIYKIIILAWAALNIGLASCCSAISTLVGADFASTVFQEYWPRETGQTRITATDIFGNSLELYFNLYQTNIRLVGITACCTVLQIR
jgi:hypothetical protein